MFILYSVFLLSKTVIETVAELVEALSKCRLSNRKAVCFYNFFSAFFVRRIAFLISFCLALFSACSSNSF